MMTARQKNKKLTPITVAEHNQPWTADDQKRFESNPVEYSRIARAVKRSPMIGFTSLAAERKISDEMYHLGARYLLRYALNSAYAPIEAIHALNLWSRVDA
jgi:hypothetical protein